MEQLNNPLRQGFKRPLAQPIATPTIATEAPATGAPAPKPIVAQETRAVAPSVPTPQKPQAPRATLSTDDIEVKRAAELLAKHGYKIKAEKQYKKHSYEIEAELFERFHEMYHILGFEHVKEAMSDAVRMWIKMNDTEYKRRRGAST